MEFLKFIKKHIHIILLCFVSPCYQLVNENVKNVHNNAVANNPNKAAVNNANKIIAAHRQPVKSSPIQISPQPLVTRKNVLLNPINSAKVQSTANKKTPIGAIVRNDETANKDAVKSKNIERKVDPEPKSQEKFHEDEDIDDLDVKSETKKVVEPISDSLITQKNKSNETVSKINEIPPKSENKIAEKIIESKILIASEKLELQSLGNALNNSKDTAEEVSITKSKKNNDIEELQVIDKRKSNKTETIPGSIDIKVMDKVTDKNDDLKNSDISVKDNDHIKPIPIGSRRRNGSKNIHKHNLGHRNNIPITTKLELNVDPKLMEKLTNDASDKIFIKNSNFEELREKYNIPSSEDTSNEDVTDLSDNLSDILEDELDLNTINSPITNDYFKNDDKRTPKDRVWRKWRNTEIHIKSNDDKDIKPNIEEPKRDLCDCYSNIQSNPIEYIANKFEPEYENVYPTTVQNPTRYYLPYTSFPSCYRPQSYGYQYAPVSRYQNYLFPCLQ